MAETNQKLGLGKKLNSPPAGVSVIVPTLNESATIGSLSIRLCSILTSLGTDFEIIFIDDYSSDDSAQRIAALPITAHAKVIRKVGPKGKGRALLQGFGIAQFNLIVMIDADLQYPPEAIPDMVHAIEGGLDLVVADREHASGGVIRRRLSRLGRNLYGKLLFGFNCDVQSGLKLFRAEVLNHANLSPASWSLDLDLLVQCRDAGFAIGSVAIDFADRESGKSHVGLVSTGGEIVWQALKIWLRSVKRKRSYRRIRHVFTLAGPTIRSAKREEPGGVSSSRELHES